jgi:ABC-type multidrug transport system fused ATPase/permease subunit
VRNKLKCPAEVSWLVQQLRPFVLLSIVNLSCILIGSLFTLADPLIIKWLIDVAIPRHRVSLVLIATAAFLGAYLASLGMGYLATVTSAIVGQKMVFRIRVSLLRHMDSLPATFHSDAQVGETLYRLAQDAERIAELSSDIFPMSMHMLVLSVIVVLAMGLLNWRLTLMILPITPLFYSLQRRFVPKLKLVADAAQAQSGKMSTFLQEHLSGALQLQLLNRIETRCKKFARIAAESARRQVKQRIAEVLFGLSSASLIVIGLSLVLGVGGYEVVRGALTLGGLVAFYAYIMRLFEPVSIAMDLQSRFQRVGASIRRIIELSEMEVPDTHGAPAILLNQSAAADLEFKSVTFSYRDRSVLRDLSFRVAAGETVALVGLNGSGKSTVGMLAARLYDPERGAIFVGAQDIREVRRRSLRSVVTLVPQEPVLFDDTVRENLLYGNPAATSAELEMVSTLAQFDQVLRTLPRGFDEPLGPSGGRLSGGEKKRLALARTLLQQPRILVVDEVTSSLDAPTAAGLLKGLELFREGRTLIVISHRPATILWADRILVVNGGRIADSGRHSDLIERSEAYRTIWKTQEEIGCAPAKN